MKRGSKVGWGLGIGFMVLIGGVLTFEIHLVQQVSRTNSVLRSAGAALAHNDFDSAIALYDGVLQAKLNPSIAVATAYCGRGIAENWKYRFDDAIRDFSEAIRLQPDIADCYLHRGYAFQRKGELDTALADYQETLKRSPNATSACYNRGLIFAQRKQWDQAIADFSEAIRCEPHHALAFFGRANAYIAKQDVDGALASLDSALSIDPTLLGALSARADIYRARGEIDKSHRDEHEVIRLRPRPLEIRKPQAGAINPTPTPLPPLHADFAALELFSRARAAYDARNYDTAIAVYTTLLARGVDAESSTSALMNRGNCYQAKNDWDKALADYETAIKLNPESAGAYVNRGTVLEHKGERNKAIDEYTEALRLNPNQLEAYINRARAHLANRDFARAKADFEAALSLQKKPQESDPSLEAATANSAGWLYATCSSKDIRDGGRAVALATKACDLTNWSKWSYLDTLAAAYAKAGAFQQATEFERKAISSPQASSERRRAMQERLALYQQHQPYREVTKP